MKIVIVGASGTIGAAVSELLAQDHQVIRVGHSQGDARVDMRDPASIRALFEQIGTTLCVCNRRSAAWAL